MGLKFWASVPRTLAQTGEEERPPGSLDQERSKIASQIQAFVKELPQKVDYRIAIMPGHGSLGKYAGRLFQYAKEPIVLDSAKMSIDQISQSLSNSLNHLPGDSGSDGGEEGLYSLAQGFSGKSLSNIQKQGFLRSDAALAVVFISDENDICYRYPEDAVGVLDPDHREGPAFERDCANVTPERVLALVKNHMGRRPLLINGIVYTNPDTVPHSGENEIGHGYLDLISLNHGVAVDLAQTDFHQGLSAIGQLASQRLTLISRFPMEVSNNIDPKSLRVRIDGQPVAAQIEGNEIVLGDDLGEAKSIIEAQYCSFKF